MIIWPSNSAPGCIPKGTKAMPMLVFTTAKRWKQPKCPPTRKWVNTTWSVSAREYYSVLKKVWNFDTWSKMDELSKHGEWAKQGTKIQTFCDFTLCEGPRIRKFIERDSRTKVTRSWRGGRRGNDCSVGTEFLSAMMKNVWVRMVLMVAQQCECTQCQLKMEKRALAGVAQWSECRPVNQRVAGSIPSQGTCLGCGPGPH